MMEDRIARAMAMDAKNGGGSGGDSYSKAAIDAKLDEIKEMLAEYVKKTDYATKTEPGIGIADPMFGIEVGSGSKSFLIREATDDQIDKETEAYRPVCPNRIPRMMSNYGITDKDLINKILSRLDAIDHDTSAQSHLAAMAQRRAESAAKAMEEPNYERTEDI